MNRSQRFPCSATYRAPRGSDVPFDQWEACNGWVRAFSEDCVIFVRERNALSAHHVA